MVSQNSANTVFCLVLFSASILIGANFTSVTASSVGDTAITVASLTAQTQVRDHLTEKEDELVRQFQEIDKRMEIYIKAADRRLLVLVTPNATQKKKEQETWGPLPTGTKLELLRDYKLILEEAEEKMDDALNRDSKSPLLDKALSKFKEGAQRQISQLRLIGTQLTEKSEQRALAEAIEEAETVTKASSNQ